MPKERREYCLTLPIIAFTLTVCYIVLNPHGKDIWCTEEAVKKCYAIFLISICFCIYAWLIFIEYCFYRYD